MGIRPLHGLIPGLLLTAAPMMADELPREPIGDRLFASNVALADNGDITFHTLSNIRFGHGQGEDLTRWRRSAGDREWTREPLPFPESHRPGMITSLDLNRDSTLYLYVDRARREHLYLQQVHRDGTVRTLFDLGGGGRLLNPVMDRMPDGRLHLLLPNRGGRVTRRFVVDPATTAHERLPDIEMPRGGARIYQRHQAGDRLFVPLTVNRELLMMGIHLDDHTVRIQSLDRSAPREQPRVTRIFGMDDTNELVLVYMRPAEFSNRGRTGLLGEMVCAVVDTESFEVRSSTVIAGFKAEAAATHNHAVIQVGPREFLHAHTEVDRVHERHRSGRYENYVGSYLTRWRIDEKGAPVETGRRALPFTSFFSLANNAAGDVILLANDAREGDPLFLYRFHADAILEPR